jgi:hypothetical protein
MHDRLRQTLTDPDAAPDADLLAAEQALIGRLEDARKRQAEAAGSSASDGASLLLSDDPAVFDTLAAKERSAAHEAAAVAATLDRLRAVIQQRREVAAVRAADQRLAAELVPLAVALEEARAARALLVEAEAKHAKYLGALRATVGRIKMLAPSVGKLDGLAEDTIMLEISTAMKEGVTSLASDFERRYAVPAEMLIGHWNEFRNRAMADHDGLDLPTLPAIERVMAAGAQRMQAEAETRAEQAAIREEWAKEAEPEPPKPPATLAQMRALQAKKSVLDLGGDA